MQPVRLFEATKATTNEITRCTFERNCFALCVNCCAHGNRRQKFQNMCMDVFLNESDNSSTHNVPSVIRINQQCVPDQNSFTVLTPLKCRGVPPPPQNACVLRGARLFFIETTDFNQYRFPHCTVRKTNSKILLQLLFFVPFIGMFLITLKRV